MSLARWGPECWNVLEDCGHGGISYKAVWTRAGNGETSGRGPLQDRGQGEGVTDEQEWRRGTSPRGSGSRLGNGDGRRRSQEGTPRGRLWSPRRSVSLESVTWPQAGQESVDPSEKQSIGDLGEKPSVEEECQTWVSVS